MNAFVTFPKPLSFSAMTLLVGSIFHMTRKIVSEMTYNVSMGTLNPTIPIPYLNMFSAQNDAKIMT